MLNLNKCLQLSAARLHLLVLSENLHGTGQRSQTAELPKSVADLAREQPKKVVNPLKSEDFFQVKQLVKLEDLFK